MSIVIYTTITGGYDKLRQPISVDDRFSFICFSNEYLEEKIGVWKIRKFPKVVSDSQRLSRYPKLKPHELLSEFDYSVYMDANLVIAKNDFYENILQLIQQKQILAGIKNGWRDCLYDEGFRCILSKLDTPKKIIREMRYIKSENFPIHYGMYEANIIFRDHNNEKVINQSNMWWNMVQEYAKRDQLCFTYTLWKCGFSWCYIFPDGTNTHNNSSIVFHEHPHRKIQSRRISLRKLFKFLKPVLYVFYKLIISLKIKKR